jgi:acyl-CoA reductase-like NAD-dependent aldehyde dehydrogenase
VALELGGNAPLVVLDDADLEHAVRSAVVGRFLHQGQVCMSTNRIIVDASIYDEFVDRFIAHVRTLKYGDPSDPSVSIGQRASEERICEPAGTQPIASGSFRRSWRKLVLRKLVTCVPHTVRID